MQDSKENLTGTFLLTIKDEFLCFARAVTSIVVPKATCRINSKSFSGANSVNTFSVLID